MVADGAAVLALSDIRIDGGTQPRVALDETIVAEYAEAMATGVVFPAIVVFTDGVGYWLADGFHRYFAALKSGLDTLPMDVREGTRRDAVLYSVGANTEHGLRRTNEDKRRAVLTLLEDPEWSQWSNREIARRCSVHNATVDKLRANLSADFRQIADRKVERGGTTYTQDTSRIGKSHATHAARAKREAVLAALADNPQASSQEVAELAGVNPGTVSRIRVAHGMPVQREAHNRKSYERISTFISGNLVGVRKSMEAIIEPRRSVASPLVCALAVAEPDDAEHWLEVLGELAAATRQLRDAIKGESNGSQAG